MAKVIKVVLISIGSKRSYGYSAWRVVECEENQRGYKSERGVNIIWESENLYRPYATRSDSKGYQARQYAEKLAEQVRANNKAVA